MSVDHADSLDEYLGTPPVDLVEWRSRDARRTGEDTYTALVALTDYDTEAWIIVVTNPGFGPGAAIKAIEVIPDRKVRALVPIPTVEKSKEAH